MDFSLLFHMQELVLGTYFKPDFSAIDKSVCEHSLLTRDSACNSSESRSGDSDGKQIIIYNTYGFLISTHSLGLRADTVLSYMSSQTIVGLQKSNIYIQPLSFKNKLHIRLTIIENIFFIIIVKTFSHEN